MSREGRHAGIEGEQVLLRIIVSESRRHDRRPVFTELLDRVLPKIDALMTGGVVTVERARVIRYAHAARPDAPGA